MGHPAQRRDLQMADYVQLDPIKAPMFDQLNDGETQQYNFLVVQAVHYPFHRSEKVDLRDGMAL